MLKSLAKQLLFILPFVAIAETDTDGDRMPDAWETRFPMSVANPLVRDGRSDADSDGWGNFSECRYGSEPDASHDAPSPVIRINLTSEGSTNSALVVRARLTNGTDWAVWRIPAPGTKQEKSMRISARHLLSANIPVVSMCGRIEGISVRRIRTANDGSEIVTALHVSGNLVMTSGGTVVGDVNRETGLVRFRKGRLSGILDPRDAIDISATVISAERRYSSVIELGAPDKGAVREGVHCFEAWCDDGNGIFDVDEPYGYAVPADIGWHHPTVDIQITRLSSVFDRIDIRTGQSARNDLLGNEDGGTKYWKNFILTNSYFGTSTSNIGKGNVRVRIIPFIAYGTKQKEYSPGSYLAIDAFKNYISYADFRMDSSDGYVITEGRILSNGDLDLGYNVLFDDIRLNNALTDFLGDIIEIYYRIVIGESDVSHYQNYHFISNTVNACTNIVVREFEEEEHRKKPLVFDESPRPEEFGACPTFCWRCDETKRTSRFGCSYTAFMIEILKDNVVVHNTGYKRMPPIGIDGVFRWKSDSYFGDQLSTGISFDPGAYSWRVSMHNAKFIDELWSDSKQFFVTNDAAHVYQTLPISVKYAGQMQNAIGTTNLTNQIRIAAFDTADFTGEPLSRTFVRNASGLDSSGAPATLLGLDVGTCWVVGWLDVDGDFILDDGEPWGCYCDDTFDPLPIAVRNSGPHPSSITIEIKD